VGRREQTTFEVVDVGGIAGRTAHLRVGERNLPPLRDLRIERLDAELLEDSTNGTASHPKNRKRHITTEEGKCLELSFELLAAFFLLLEGHDLDPLYLSVAQPDHPVREPLERHVVCHHHQRNTCNTIKRQLTLFAAYLSISFSVHYLRVATSQNDLRRTFLVEVGEQLKDDGRVHGIQVARGLVQQEDVRLVGDRTRDRNLSMGAISLASNI
jgi:hypothetical protein